MQLQQVSNAYISGIYFMVNAECSLIFLVLRMWSGMQVLLKLCNFSNVAYCHFYCACLTPQQFPDQVEGLDAGKLNCCWIGIGCHMLRLSAPPSGCAWTIQRQWVVGWAQLILVARTCRGVHSLFFFPGFKSLLMQVIALLYSPSFSYSLCPVRLFLEGRCGQDGHIIKW